MKPKEKILFDNAVEAEIESRDYLEKTEEEVWLETAEVKNVKPLIDYPGTFFVEFRGGAGIFKSKLHKEINMEEGATLRERAAYLVDKFLGFGLVPTTVIKNIDGKEGSVQKFISGAKDGWEVSKEELLSYKADLLKIGLLDYITWNQDRGIINSGNILLKGGKLYAIDNSLSFHGKEEPYYFDALFDNPVPKEIIDGLNNFSSSNELKEELRGKLKDLLPENEASACLKRIEKACDIILEEGQIPISRKHELTFE